MSDPISRLEVVRREIDRVFGDGYAAAHPDAGRCRDATAASDWAASRLAVAIERVAVALLAEDEEMQKVAEALLVEDKPVPQNGLGIVRAHGVMRP